MDKFLLKRAKKHLSFGSLRNCLLDIFSEVSDNRQGKKVEYNLVDCLMSSFAMMYFQDPSLLEFQRRWEEDEGASNLQTIFKLQHTPSDRQFRDILDNVLSSDLEVAFLEFFRRLQRNKYLEGYEFIYGKYLLPLDGSEYFSSDHLGCSSCLTKKRVKKKDGKSLVRYHHQILQGVIVHPNKKQVIPLAPEAIQNTDGTEKQDCELNAGKRMLKKIRKSHPKLGIIISGDGLFSKQSYIEDLKQYNMSYILIAKPDDHKVMYRRLETLRAIGKVHELEEVDEKGNLHTYYWVNGIDLNGNTKSIKVNYFAYELFNQKKDKITYRNSWITDIAISPDNIRLMVKGGRARWKIENETFNTLKNQGYHIEHNFGHGKKNLSMNFFMMNLLAFFMHQIFELTDQLYRKARAKFGSRIEYWNQLRCTFRILIFKSWEELLIRIIGKPRPP